MKAIFITIFLNYELFLCKTVHKKTLNETFLTRNLHRSLIEIDSLLRGVQKEIQKERKIIKTQLDYEHAIIPEDSNVLGYDVTDLFWGETGVEGVTHEDVTSTFLPTPPTPPPTEEDYGEAYEENTEPPIPPPPPTTTMEINTNYPGYPYEPPPFNPIGYEPENTPTPRNDSFDFLLTPPIFDTTTRSPYDEVKGLPTTPTPVDIDTPPPTPIPDYSFTTIKYTFDLPSPPGPETQTRQKIRMNSYDFAVTPPDFGKLTRSLIDDFNKYFGFMFQNNKPSKLSTLARKPFNAPLKTPHPPRTTKRLSKYLMRNEQKLNLMSHVTPASEKAMHDFENRFRHVATTPVQWWTAKKSVRARVPLMPAASSLSKSQLWAQQHMKNSAPVHREGGLTPQEEPGFPPSQPDHKTAATTTETTRLTARTGVFDSFGIPQYNPLTSTSLSTAASFNDTRLIFGDIGIKKSTKAPTERRVYLKMMEELNEGYLPIFLLEIFRITSLKDEKPVKELLEEVELHVNT
ncbi:uncharacterized protein LOC118281035 [Spodoptera frugiperda]|uniref:Uncharacterized protein LOC118281035 n=1 Tax=Spodoptera frugiperda TaxID=7108 RepID=A0A9R0E0P5_SPOFR|nr:uncharacterized protein LOC118281035 [Spodoptera frugiperda]